MSKKALVGYLIFIGIYVMLITVPYGGLKPFLGNPARAAYVLLLLVAVVASSFTQSSGLSGGVREDRTNRWIFVPLTLLSLLLLFLPPWCDAHDVWVWDGNAARWAGVVLGSMGMVLRLWPVFTLGRRFSGVVAIQPHHTLETSGPYRFIRHPSYLGLLITVVGMVLVFRCLWGLSIGVGIFWTLIARMDAEEKLLAEHFGEPYEAYKARTWRLIPFVY